MMLPRASLAVCLAIFPLGYARGVEDPEDAGSVFEAKVRPVLAETCFRCHGGEKVSGGLRVDSRGSLLEGGDSGPAIAPGDAEGSLLVQAIRRTHETLRMPPGKPLADAVVADFAEWVRRGAVWPDTGGSEPFRAKRHWAFEPVRATAPPEGPSGESPHPIDRFLAVGLRRHRLRPNPKADKRTLLRRVTFDLIGLPPRPEEIAAFLADDSPAAFARVVDRLLASPQYGERWGRHWMDVVRYSDTAGDNADYPIPEAHLYRDYLIDSFNRDKPYDQFVREQLAGDLLADGEGPDLYAERTIATGFLALSRRYATAPEELWHLTIEDAIETTGRAFLGLSLRCARCHDHKFDPVTQADYYALYGIFASTKFPYAGSEEFASKGFPRAHFRPLIPPEAVAPRVRAHEGKLQALRDEIKGLEHDGDLARGVAELDSQLGPLSEAIRDLERIGQTPGALKDQRTRLERRRAEGRARLQAGLEKARAELRALERPGLPADVPGAYAVREAAPTDEAIHRKGDPAQKGAVVKRGVPRYLAGELAPKVRDGSSGRLELADWLARPENPLTARVMVNRIWQHHFGRGIVATPSNFGTRGEPPSHPELLDWLADRFVASGWSIKAMHRLIVSSGAYQRSSDPEPADAEADPANLLYRRFDRRRLDAEAVRDAMLAVSGNLDTTRPGPHPFPPIARWGWTQHNPFKAVYPTDRRSVYLMTQRLQRHPFLALFDGADANESTAARTRSTVPLQALYLLNNPFVLDQARGLARRLTDSSPDATRRVDLGYELAWGRPPDPLERERALDYVRRYAEGLSPGESPHEAARREAWVAFAKILLMANEFLYVD